MHTCGRRKGLRLKPGTHYRWLQEVRDSCVATLERSRGYDDTTLITILANLKLNVDQLFVGVSMRPPIEGVKPAVEPRLRLGI